MFRLLRKEIGYLLLLACIQLAGLGLFCRGFFPYKVYLPGFANESVAPPWPVNQANGEPLLEPQFDRLVFVVIDALRNDFVLGPESGFTFVKSLIDSGVAVPFTARATAPTVTMPRIKALTTGTVPSFLDAILNIAESDTTSSLAYHDNWVQQFKSKNKTMHFFGDDTWLRLFPNTFTQYDGTTSFYVSDTVQVDRNVTRHIKSAFSKSDWDAIILHYLGLDHVGHLGGARSPLMIPKQKEMDRAIETIYDIVANQDAKRYESDPNAKGTLIVVCGDHGMTDEGNHGGSSTGETSAALVFISPRYESRPMLVKSNPYKPIDTRKRVYGAPVIEQIDLVPTLASLFAFPIPKNSIGKIIPDLFLKRSAGVNLQGLLRALQLNAYQLGRLWANVHPELIEYLENPGHQQEGDTGVGTLYSQAFSLHRQFMEASANTAETYATEAIAAYLKFIEITQTTLMRTASNYNLTDMTIGTLLITAASLTFVAWSARIAKQTLGPLASEGWVWSMRFGLGAMTASAASMFASSFIEEERFIWYYFTQTIFALAAFQSFKTRDAPSVQYTRFKLLVALLVLTRIGVAWQENGEKWMAQFPSLRWHVLAVALTAPLLAGAKKVISIGRLDPSAVNVSSSGSYILLLCKAVFLFISGFLSLLVMVYKIRSEGAHVMEQIPDLYKEQFANIELVRQLDLVHLGQLIYNYAGSSLFMLAVLFYVYQRASVLTLEDEENNQDSASNTHKRPFLHLVLHTSTPLLILLTRSQSAVLFIISLLQFWLLRRLFALGKTSVPVWFIAIATTCLSQCGFFMTNHSNSIASVDLSMAYIGVSGYNPIVIGLLTFCSNWSASLWWVAAGWVLVTEHSKQLDEYLTEKNEPWLAFLVAQSALYGVFLTVLSIAVHVLREHLFIWTVFSPKYLYQLAWTCLFHWGVQVGVGTLVAYVFGRGVDRQYAQETATVQ